MNDDKYFRPLAPTEETAKETLLVLKKIERHLAKIAATVYPKHGEDMPGIIVWNANED